MLSLLVTTRMVTMLTLLATMRMLLAMMHITTMETRGILKAKMRINSTISTKILTRWISLRTVKHATLNFTVPPVPILTASKKDTRIL